VALGPLLTDLIRLLGVSHPGRPIHLGGNLEVAVLGDPDALTQVLLILLDNALKFTPVEGTVSVDIRTYDGLVSIAVRDTGPGIDPDAVPHIFKRFYQGDTARAGSGAGLGLAIAKALVEGQHGNISVQSEVGRGSVFTVTVPSAKISQTHVPARLSGA
jgi:signal transduction histidine kinase